MGAGREGWTRKANLRTRPRAKWSFGEKRGRISFIADNNGSKKIIEIEYAGLWTAKSARAFRGTRGEGGGGGCGGGWVGGAEGYNLYSKKLGRSWTGSKGTHLYTSN